MCNCWFPISRQCHLMQLGLPVALCSASPLCCHQIASPACSGLWERTRSPGATFLGDIVDRVDRVFPSALPFPFWALYATPCQLAVGPDKMHGV